MAEDKAFTRKGAPPDEASGTRASHSPSEPMQCTLPASSGSARHGGWRRRVGECNGPEWRATTLMGAGGRARVVPKAEAVGGRPQHVLQEVGPRGTPPSSLDLLHREPVGAFFFFSRFFSDFSVFIRLTSGVHCQSRCQFSLCWPRHMTGGSRQSEPVSIRV